MPPRLTIIVGIVRFVTVAERGAAELNRNARF